MNLRATVAATLVALLATSSIVRAQPVPTINAPAPVSILRGHTIEIPLKGSALQTASTVLLPEDSGLRATLGKAEKPDGSEAKITVVAAADAPPGMLAQLRLGAPGGVSAPVQVWVEQFPLASDRESNNTPDTAQPVSLPAVLSGTIGTPGDSDLYRFAAAKGQKLVFNCLAGRLRSPLDANLLLYDAATGRELASNNDTFGPDPFIAFEVPADGQYGLEVRDLQYRGGPDFAYRIEAGAIPFIQSYSPMSSRRGSVVDVKASGFNLGGAETIHLDLRFVPSGRLPLRVRTDAGVSNELPFEVTELPQTVEGEPNDDPKTATDVSPGSDVSGVISKPNDVDFFRFKIDRPQRILIDAYARRQGSPLDALLTLYDASGKPIATNDDAAGADARLTRDLAAGEYLLSIRDIGYSGGSAFAYRVSVQPTLAPPDAGPQDFTLNFQPDTPRIHRGGYAKLWCDVSRQNFPADVTLTVEGLPPGLNVASPVVFPPVTSGLLMLVADGNVALGTYPITIKATANLGGELVTRTGRPEAMGGRIVQQAYLTVLDAAPLAVAPLATLPADRVNQLAAEIPQLANKVLAPSPEVDARQAEWEKKVLAATTWTTLDAQTFTSDGRANLVKQSDGSILASGINPAMERYTVTSHTDLKGIVAVRLECLTDPTLGGGKGPGRAPNGNFVLTDVKVTAAPKSDPGKPTPVKIARGQATFNQSEYEVDKAFDDKPTTGWAIAPQMGQQQTAIFFPKEPIAGNDGGTVLTIALEQNYGANHVIGRFRLSVTTDAGAADVPVVPDAILAMVKTPPDKRTPDQKAGLSVYFRLIDPPLAPTIAKLMGLQTVVAPQAEMTRLDAALNTQSPQLDAEQAAWEKSLLDGNTWIPLESPEYRSANGVSFGKEADGSAFAFGASPLTDTYTVTGTSPLKNVTGVRIEALPDPRLPGNGPGRAGNGNFILSGFKVGVAPAGKPEDAKPVEIAGASASFQQDKYPVSDALDAKPETGWAILPAMGYPSSADFLFKTPQNADGKSMFVISLEQLASAIPQHTLGRFRVSFTSSKDPVDASVRLPTNILAILKTPAAQRTPEQKNEIAVYHRRISKMLQPVRQRLTEYRAVVPAYPPAIQRGRAAYLPVVIARGQGFASGDVQVTMEGFTLGRDPAGPPPIARSIKLTPLTVGGDNLVGALAFTAEGNAEVGTRLVVLRAEAKVGDQTIVQYSAPFALTVR